MAILCPWCRSDIPYGATVCPYCTRNLADWNRHVIESFLPPPRPPAHTLPCHGCGAFVPEDLFGDSRAGGEPGRCPACNCSLDTAYWDKRFEESMKRLQKCGCGDGHCLACGGSGRRTAKFLFFPIPIPCPACRGSGSCQMCLGLKEYDPVELSLRVARGEITKLPEPRYTTFVPPQDWTYQCPKCGARVQHAIDVCWNCNYGGE